MAHGIQRLKRGGQDVTVTVESSAVPTGPPTSSFHHGRPIPKIAGSEGGFIGLVVGLGVLVIGGSIGVWFLLRYRRSGGRMTRSKNGAVDAQFPTRKGTLFGFRSSPARGGWVQASGGEEWESDGEEERGLRGAGAAMPMSDRVGGAAGGQQMPAEGPYASGGHGERDGRWSTSTVRLEAPGKDTGDGEETFYDPYEDTLPTHNEHEQQQQPQHPPGQIDTAAQVAQRHQSSDSTNTISPTTFTGGTKFKEGLS